MGNGRRKPVVLLRAERGLSQAARFVKTPLYRATLSLDSAKPLKTRALMHRLMGLSGYNNYESAYIHSCTDRTRLD